MRLITATLTLKFDPQTPPMKTTWAGIIKRGRVNEFLETLILVEPGFGVGLVAIEDAEISGEKA